MRLSQDAIASLCANLLPDEVEILGPAPASIMRVARRYRWQILLKSEREFSLEIKQELINLRQYCHNSVSLVIDPDPLRIE